MNIKNTAADRAMLEAVAQNGMSDLPIKTAIKIREALAKVVDKGSFIDIGTDGDSADLHPVIDGIEWHLNISVSLPTGEVQ